MSKKKERLYIEKRNKYGSKMKIIDYKDANHITVYFEDYNYYKETSWKNFNNGIVKSPYCKTVFGIGYIGEGKYKPYDENDEPTLHYSRWKAILNRCYYDKGRIGNKNNTYEVCEIEDYFLNFQNFAKWLDEQLINCPFEEWFIDKDILEKGNKIYNREHMILVDKRINNLFTKSDIVRGEYPIGVNFHKRDEILEVSCSIYEDGKKKKIYLGRFTPNQVEEAFQCYKTFKENYIKQVADDYYSQGLIPKKLYDAMYKYEVEITD